MEKASSFLTVFLTIAIVLVAVLGMAEGKTTDIEEKEIISLGSYPQSVMKDSKIIKNLENLELDAEDSVFYNGERYKRVSFDKYTSFGGEPTEDEGKSFQKGNGFSAKNVYWFKYEPIQWLVLEKKDGELILVSKDILSAKPYNKTEASVTWGESTLRTWLNDDFFKSAFSEEDKANIVLNNLKNDNNANYGTSGGEDTKDYVYLMSLAGTESFNFGHDVSKLEGGGAKLRRAVGTDFAKSEGLHTSEGELGLSYSSYWLRSPGYISSTALSVDNKGSISEKGAFVYTCITGVRPCIRVKADIIP